MSVADAVDIVLVNDNRDGDIQRCIESIHKYTDGVYNLIVVDQNSKDGSRDWLINEKAASHLILNKMARGRAGGRNQGIRAGRYPWIVMIDCGCEIKDRMWLDKVWNYTIDRRIGFVECRVKFLHEEKHRFLGLAFCAIRRQCLNEVGHFDWKFRIGEFSDWIVRFEMSWWNVAWCYDTDIDLHKMDYVRYEEKERIYDFLAQKYTKDYIARTSGKYADRQRQKEGELLWAGAST